VNQTALIIGGAALFALITSRRGNASSGGIPDHKRSAGGSPSSTPSTPSTPSTSSTPSTPSYTPSQSTPPSGASSADVRAIVTDFQEAINDMIEDRNFTSSHGIRVIDEDGLLGNGTLNTYEKLREALKRNPSVRVVTLAMSLPQPRQLLNTTSIADGVYTDVNLSQVQGATRLLDTL